MVSRFKAKKLAKSIVVSITAIGWVAAPSAFAADAALITAAAPITYKMDRPTESRGYVSSAPVTPQSYYRAPAARPSQPLAVPQAAPQIAPQVITPQVTPQPAPQIVPHVAVPDVPNPIADSQFDLSNIDRTLYKHMKLGKPYKVAGKQYVPDHNPDYDKTGIASWYGDKFHGKLTANGETYDKNAMTAAHKTLPLNSYVIVTNLETGQQIKVRLNDRGPFIDDRIIDLSQAAAHALGMHNDGLANVRVQYAGPADPSDVSGDVAMNSAPVVQAPVQAPVETPTAPSEELVAEIDDTPTNESVIEDSAPAAPSYTPLRRQAEETQPQSPETGAQTAEQSAETPKQFEFMSEPAAPAPQTEAENTELESPELGSKGINLPHIETPEEWNQMPGLPAPDQGTVTEEDGTMTLTIKGPIHMAKHETAPETAKLIPADYKK